VAFEGVLPGDFTGSSDAEALFCTGIGFHFWHGDYVYLLLCADMQMCRCADIFITYSFCHLHI